MSIPPYYTTNGSNLQFNYNNQTTNVILIGFSLTGTEYIASEGATTNALFNYNNGQAQNLEGLYNVLNSLPVPTIGTPFKAPMVRIPLCADYWLAGSASTTTQTFNGLTTSTTSYPYGTPTTSFPSQKRYDQGIAKIINTIYNNIKNPILQAATVFILDLHWNYSTSSSSQNSANGSTGSTANEEQLGQQTPMALASNSPMFWQSVALCYGVNSNYIPLSSTSRYFSDNSLDFNPATVFFELYNEPYLSGPGVPLGDSQMSCYTDKFDCYIYGTYYYSNNNTYKAYTSGMGQLYNMIRGTPYTGSTTPSGNVVYNMILFNAAEIYGYINFNPSDNTAPFSYSPTIDVTGNIGNTYNCFTKLINAIQNETITSITDPINQSKYSTATVFNVCIGFHPYSTSEYNNSTTPPYSKAPGYNYFGNNYLDIYGVNTTNNGLYDSSGSSGTYETPLFGNMLYCLTNINAFSSNNEFYVNLPIICTETGQYSYPWNNAYEPPTTYSNPSNASLSDLQQFIALTSEVTGSSTSVYGYAGGWFDQSGKNLYAGPALVGTLLNYQEYNVSYSLWAYRNAQYSENTTLNSQTSNGAMWGAYQPDCFCNNSSNSSYSTSDVLYLLSDTANPLNNFITFSDNSSEVSLVNSLPVSLNGNSGADMGFIWANYMAAPLPTPTSTPPTAPRPPTAPTPTAPTPTAPTPTAPTPSTIQSNSLQNLSIKTIPNPIIAGQPATITYQNISYLPIPNNNYVLKNSFNVTVSSVFSADNSDMFTFTNVDLMAGLNVLYVYNLTTASMSSTFNIEVSSICFREGTKILCRNGYLPIEQLNKSVYVKTYKNGYKKVKYLIKTKMINSSKKTINKLYLMRKSKNNGLIEDLFVTGSHALLKNQLSEKEAKKMNTLLSNFKDVNYERTIDDKQKVLACFDKRFEEYNKEGYFNIYHIVLEDENNNTYKNYGIYANGILAESTMEKTLNKLNDFDLINIDKSNIVKSKLTANKYLINI